MKKKSLLLPLLLSILICKGQPSAKNSDKVNQLCVMIDSLFHAARSEEAIYVNDMHNAPSEAIVILLQVDSTGRIYDIHLLADSKNKDSAYIILSSWKANDFRAWKDETYKGKTIMVPFIVLSRTEQPGYVSSLTSISVGLPKVVRDLVMTKTIVTSWSFSIPDNELTPGVQVR